MELQDEYDFSKAVRGKFYHPDAHLQLPICLDDDISELIERFASQGKTNAQTVVNEVLWRNKELLQAL